MSFLEKIRKKSWLVVSVIGLAMLAFLIDPKSIANFFSKDPNILGKVNGKEITRKDYLEFQNLIESFQKNNPIKLPKSILDAQIWKSLIVKTMMEEQTLKAEIEISKRKSQEIDDQLNSMIGQEGKNKLSKEQQEVLTFQKNLMIGEILTNQYYEMIQKGLNTSSIENALIQKEKDTKAHINYVMLPYKELEEKTKAETKKQDPFPISKEEIEIYLKANEIKFKRKEETRDLNLVVFNVEVSKEDEIKIANQVHDLAKEFKSAKDNSIFASSHSDFPTYDNARYLIGKNLPDYLRDFLKKAPVGSVYGPKKENSVYLITKLTDKKMISPSTKSSHILIAYDKAERSSQKRSKEEAKKIADEFYKKIKENPKEFDNLVEKSDDKSALQNKGSLGRTHYGESHFVEPFQKFIDESPKNHLGIVETPFGYHIVRIDDKEAPEQAYQLALIIKNIKPSTQTEDLLYKKAKACVEDSKNKNLNSFIDSVRKTGNKLILAQDIKSSDSIISELKSSLDNEIIAWAFEKKTKERQSKLFTSKEEGFHVVAYLGKIKPKGLPPIDESIQAKIKPILKKDKIFDFFLKKEKVKELKEFGNVKKSEVDFYHAKVLEEGVEPDVVAASFSLDMGKIHGPIKGEKGIYFIEILKREETEKKTNSLDKESEIYNKNKYLQLIKESIERKAIIKDYRKKKN